MTFRAVGCLGGQLTSALAGRWTEGPEGAFRLALSVHQPITAPLPSSATVGPLGQHSEVTAEFQGLVRSFQGTLTAGEASEVLEFVDAQDLGLAVQALCGILLDGNKRVTRETYTRIRSLVRQIDGVDSYLIESVRSSGPSKPRPLDCLPHPHRVQWHVDVPHPQV